MNDDKELWAERRLQLCQQQLETRKMLHDKAAYGTERCST